MMHEDGAILVSTTAPMSETGNRMHRGFNPYRARQCILTGYGRKGNYKMNENKEQQESDQKWPIVGDAIKKNVKRLVDVCPKVASLGLESSVVENALWYEIEQHDVPRPTCYPIRGKYIEIILDGGITFDESETKQKLEMAIEKKLRCTCSPPMSGHCKILYRIDD